MKYPFYILFFLLISASVFAKEVPSTFVYVSSENGLSSNRINRIFKDSRGFVWLATQVGINRFDGNVVKHYKQVGNDEVFCIAETDERDLWIGTENGLKRLNRETNAVTHIDLGIEHLSIRDMLCDEEKRLILATDRGLFIIANGNYQHAIFDNGLSNSNVLNAITRSDKDNYWFATLSGICHYNAHTGQTNVLKSIFDNSYNNFFAITCVDSVLYAGSYNKGIMTYDIKANRFDIIKEFQDNYILNVSHYDRDLYVGTNGNGLKIYSLDKKEITNVVRHELKDPNSIASNAIYSFLLDDDSFLIGTYNAGLNYNPKINNYFQAYKNSKFNSSDYNVRSFYINANGDRLIGTRSGLLFLSKDNSVIKQFNQSDNSILASDIILYIAPYDRPNEFLIGTYGGGVYLFDASTLSLSRPIKSDVFVDGCIFRFFKDREGTWWFATDKGLYEWQAKANKLTNYSMSNSGLINNNVLTIYEDSKNRIWIATSGGLCLFDKISKTIKSNVLPNSDIKVVNYVFEDSESNIWLASHQGFAKLNPSLNNYSNIQINQENIGVMSIVEDANKNIWLATTQGIVKYNILDGKYKTYNTSDGISGYNFANNVQKTSANDFWWANESGLIHCYLPNTEQINNTRQPVITNIVYKNRTQADPVYSEFTQKITLANDQNDVRFELSLLNYSLSRSNVYEYILEGYDDDWRSQIGKNEVEYFNIPPGKYVFKVRNPNDNSLETSVELVVRHNFSTLVWIVIICIVSVLIIVLLLYKNRILALRKTAEYHPDREKYTYSKIQNDDAEHIIKLLDEYMRANKPFLNQDLKQVDVAKDLGINSSELSQVLNQFLGTNFFDYINKFRIDELVKRMKDKSSTKYTLDALAEKCGFSSRSSFFRAIKKQTGQTPAEFLNGYAKGNKLD